MKFSEHQAIATIRDVFLFSLDTAQSRTIETISDLTDEEFHWEPLSAHEKEKDLLLPPAKKKVWRIYKQDGVWRYDYTPEHLDTSPFTTIAWIMNHIAQTAEMYLHCVNQNEPEGVSLKWDDLPVYSSHKEMSRYLLVTLDNTRSYLNTIPEGSGMVKELNELTPAPWGELRPTYLNLWGGIIEHTIQHTMQIAVRKEYIRYKY